MPDTLPPGRHQAGDRHLKSNRIWDNLTQTGLTKFGTRYYDPALGRFTQQDPSGKDLAYAYAADNPTNYIDPAGTNAFGDFFTTNCTALAIEQGLVFGADVVDTYLLFVGVATLQPEIDVLALIGLMAGTVLAEGIVSAREENGC